MTKQNFFYIRKDMDTGSWIVIGPVKADQFVGKDSVQMDDGYTCKIKDTFHTKGGATKQAYRRNYDDGKKAVPASTDQK